MLDKDGNLVVIDHNQAFSPDFTTREFQEFHLFADSFSKVLEDFVEQEHYASRLSVALEQWQEICHNIPPEWYWINDEQDVPANFNLDLMHQQLSRCMNPEFWRMV